jgi:GTP cyclohydrolase I
MTLRGVNKRAPRLRTEVFTGALSDDLQMQQRFLDAIPTSW